MNGYIPLTLAIAGILIAISLIDLKTYRIPDMLNFGFLILGLVAATVLQREVLHLHLVGAAIGYLGIYLLNLLYKLIRGRDGIGMGDAKLLAAGGGLLGITALPFIIFIAALSGLTYALMHSLLRKQSLTNMAIPFGPFLCFGIWLIWLWELPIELI